MGNVPAMDWVFLIVLVATWLALCVLVGKYAAKKGRSWGLFTLIAVITSPVLALIIALLVEDKSDSAQERLAVQGSSDDLDRLKQLGELRTSGVLTDEEFAIEKARVLAQTKIAAPPKKLPRRSETYIRALRPGAVATEGQRMDLPAPDGSTSAAYRQLHGWSCGWQPAREDAQSLVWYGGDLAGERRPARLSAEDIQALIAE